MEFRVKFEYVLRNNPNERNRRYNYSFDYTFDDFIAEKISRQEDRGEAWNVISDRIDCEEAYPILLHVMRTNGKIFKWIRGPYYRRIR